MFCINNPYLYHPHPLLKRAADDICLYIEQRPDWAPLFEQGKMLGVLLAKRASRRDSESSDYSEYSDNSDYSLNSDNLPSCCHPLPDGQVLLIAYSGVVNGLADDDHYFVPPIYDLSAPDDFYLQEDEAISQINQEIRRLQELPKSAEVEQEIRQWQEERKQKSITLQLKIFSHFNICNAQGEYRNVVDIFRDAKRGLPPGGTGECAAPRLLQYALEHQLEPIALAEFWYGRSPRRYRRAHGQFYPSCIEKCSPLLAYMTQGCTIADIQPVPSQEEPTILFEDERLIVVSKPAGTLSVPAKDTSLPNVEQWLKQRYPDCRLPFMLAHRLDQATSGVLLAAKDAQTHKMLQQAFEQKRIHKRYLALLEGEIPSSCGIIHLPLCTNPDDRPRQVVDWQFGKEAITRYEVLQVIPGEHPVSLLALSPLTGRTHQLRLHAASPFGLGHPMVGDTLYGTQIPAPRLMLHAQKIDYADMNIHLVDDKNGFQI